MKPGTAAIDIDIATYRGFVRLHKRGESIAVKFERVHDDAKKPERATNGAAALDVFAIGVGDRFDPERKIIHHLREDGPYTINPGEAALFVIGIKFEFPPGHVCLVNPRSGLSMKRRIELGNAPGIVDEDFRGEAGVLLTNEGDEPQTINYHDRIAQLLFLRRPMPYFREVKKLDETLRGDGGFGSTGDGAYLKEGDKLVQEVLRQWDAHFMLIAMSTAQKSTCMRGVPKDSKSNYIRNPHGTYSGKTRKFGCVIVDGDRIVGIGFNHEQFGVPSCAQAGCLRESIDSGEELETCRAVHAEEAAVFSILASDLGGSTAGTTVYVTGEPCERCARMLLELSIGTLVVLKGGYSSKNGMDVIEKSFTVIRYVDIDDVSHLVEGIIPGHIAD